MKCNNVYGLKDAFFGIMHKDVPERCWLGHDVFRVLICFFFITSMLHIPGLTMRVDSDWHFYTLGGKIVCEGGLPYLDFFDHKGPTLFFVNALGWWLWPKYMGVWVFEQMLCGLSLIFLWKGVYKRLGVVAAAFAVMSILVMKSAEAFYGRPESFAVEFTALSIGLVLMRMNAISCCAVGAICAFLFFMKQTLITPFIGLFLFVLFTQKGISRCKCLGSFVVSGLIVAVLVVGYMLQTGIFTSYLRDCFEFNIAYQDYNLYYRGRFSLGVFIQCAYDTLKVVGHYIGFPIAAVVAIFVNPLMLGDKRIRIPLCIAWFVWFAADLFLISRWGRIYGYQCLPMKFACVLSVLPLISQCEVFLLSDSVASKGRRMFLCVLLFVPMLGQEFLSEGARIYLQVKDKMSSDDPIVKVSKSLMDLPDMPMMTWGWGVSNAQLYLITGRKNISQYYFRPPLCVDGFLADDEIEHIIKRLEQGAVCVVEKFSAEPHPCGIFDDDPIFGESKFKKRLRKVLSDHFESKEVPGLARIYLPRKESSGIGAPDKFCQN